MSQQNIQFKAIPGQFNIDEAQGVVECFVAGIGNKDSVGDVLITGEFTKSLTRHKPLVVWGHNWNDPIGKVLEIYEVTPGDRRLPTKMLNAGIGGLYAKVQFNLNSEKGREAFANVAFFGQEQEWSIGYKTLDSIFDPNIQANILKEVELYEVSPVLHGANQLTGTISVKSDDTAEKCGPGGMMPHHEGMGAGPKIVVVRQDNDDDDDDRPIFSEGLAQALGDNEKERLTRELQARSGSSIQLVSATESTAKFRRMTSDGRSVMYRIGYHTPDNYVTFMFGKPELAEGQQSGGSRTVVPSQMPSMPMQVKPQVTTQSTNFVVSPEYVMPKGQDYEKSAFDQELENLAQILDETFDVKVGRTLSSRNMSKLKTVLETLQDIVSSAEKDVESKSNYIIPVRIEKAFETKQLLDPIFDYHRVESHVTEDGIVITTGVTQEFIEAIGVAEKALGRTLSGGLGKLGRAGRGAVNFDPKAWDGDGDGIVQEGTPYSRPAIPGVNDRASGGRVDTNAATRAWQNQRRSGMASRMGSDDNADEYDEAMGPPMRRPGRGMADDPVGDAASENLDRDRNAGAVRRGLSSSTGDIVSDPPENLVNDIANAAVRAVGRSGDETRLIDAAKEVLGNLTNEKLKDSVGRSVSNARKRLAEMLSDEKIIEEFQSKKAIEDFMDEVGYAVQKMLDLHVGSVKKNGTSVEQEEIEEIVDNAKSKFDDDFNELVKASKEFWSKRRKPGKFERTPEEAKKEAALDRENLMTTLREGGEPEDLEATIGSISKLFGEDSEKIISGTISAEDLIYVIERALVEIVDNDPSIDPKELANEFGDALREGASKDGANPLIVALAKEFGDEKITGGELIDYLNGVREDSVHRPDRGKIQRENIRGFASRTGAGDEGKRPRLNEYELAAIEKMVEDTGLPRKLFDDLAVTERIGNPEDAFYQAQEYGLSKEKIRGLQSQYAKALKEAKGKRKGGFASRTGGGKRLSGDDFDENDSLTAKGRKKVFDYLVDNGTDKDEANSILDRWEQNDGTAEEYMQEYDKDDRDVIENIANAASSMYEDDMSNDGERQAERRYYQNENRGFSSSTGGKWKGQKPADKDIKPGADLSGADLTDANLRGVNLTGANLKGANMEGSDLTDAVLTDANLTDANLKGSNLRAANLRDANLSYADLSRADLTSANLEGANLEEAYLRKANLTNANLSGAEMTRVDMMDANLSGANLTDAKMKRVDLVGADLRGTKMTGVDLGGALLSGVDLSGKDMRGANLSDANLSGTKLGGADLRKAKLRGADLAGQDLRGTDFAGADLSGANLTEAKLEGADLTDTDLTDATMPDGKPYKDSSSRGGFSSRTGGISSNPADDPRITNVKKLKEDIADVFNRFRTTPFGLSENSTGDDRIKWERFTQNRLNETDGAIEALYAYLADMRDLEDSGVELSASQRKNIKTFKEDIGILKRYRDNALANYRKVAGDEEADRRKATFATPVNVDRPSRGGFASRSDDDIPVPGTGRTTRDFDTSRAVPMPDEPDEEIMQRLEEVAKDRDSRTAKRRGEGTMLGRDGQIRRDEQGNIDPTEAREARAAFDQNIFNKLRELGFDDEQIESLTGVPDGGRIPEGGKPASYVDSQSRASGFSSQSRAPGKLSQNTALRRVNRAISKNGTNVLDSDILKDFLSGMSAEEINEKFSLGNPRDATNAARREINRIKANISSKANSDMDLLIYLESGFSVKNTAKLFNISPREVRKRQKRLKLELGKNIEDDDLLYLRSGLTLEETGKVLGIEPKDIRRREQIALKTRTSSRTSGTPKREMDMTLAEYAELDKVLKKYIDDSQVDGIGADEDMQVIQDILDKLDESSAANDAIPLTDKEIDDYMDTLTRMRDNGPVEDSEDKESIDKLIDSLKKTKDSKDGTYESDALQQAGTRLTPPSGGRGRTAKRSRPFKSSNGTINPHKKLDIELNDSEIGELRDELQGFIKISDNPAPLRAIAEKLEKATNGKFSVEKDEYEEVIKEIDKMRTDKRVVTSDVVTVLEQAAESQKGKYSSSDFGGGGGFSSSTGGRKNNGAPSDIPETMQKQLIMWGRQQGGLRLVQEAIQKFDQDKGTLPASYWRRLRTMYENMGPGSASGAARRGGRRGIFGRGKDTDTSPRGGAGFVIDDKPVSGGLLDNTMSNNPIVTDGFVDTRSGSMGGSQGGGVFKDPKTGKEYYIKPPKTQTHAENESLMSRFYERLGIPAGKVRVGTYQGRPKIVSEMVPGSVQVRHETEINNPAWKKAVQDTFVANAWLANWDAVSNSGNTIKGGDGKAYVIDVGGAGLFRARGEAKGSAFGPIVGEMESLRDPKQRGAERGVAYWGDIPPAEIARQVKEIGAISDSEIKQMVDAVISDKAEAKKLSDTLIARRDYLVKNWSTGKNSGGGRRSRAGMSSLSEGYAPRNKRPGESPATRPEDFEVRPRDGEPTGVGKGGAMGTKPDPKFTGDSFDQAKPEEWDELTIDEKWGWMLGEGNPEKGGTMSPAAYEGAMKKLGEEEAREELKQMTPEERRKARSASRASALSELSDNEKARLATEKEERQKRAQESSKRVKEEATAEAAQSKREKLLDAFNEWIDDSIRELSGMDYDETDINPDSEDIWDTVSTILGVEDITPKSLKEAIDELSSYVDITSGENAYEKKSLARANALLKKLLKMQSEYSEDKWFNGGEGGRSGFQSSTGGKPRPPRGIRPRPGTPEMPQSNAKREGDIKKLSTLIEQVVAELEAKRQNPSPKKGRMGFSSSTGKTMITDEATFFKDVENSLAKEIRAAQKAKNTKAITGLTKLQEIIKRSEASKTGDRRTNVGSIYMTMDEVDLILDGLQFALDQQMDAGGDKRIGWYSKLIEKIAAAAMSTFIDKSTTEIGSTRRTVTNKDGVKKKINIVPEP